MNSNGLLLYYDGKNVILDEIKDGVYTQRASLYIGNISAQSPPMLHIDGFTCTRMTLIKQEDAIKAMKLVAEHGMYDLALRIHNSIGEYAMNDTEEQIMSIKRNKIKNLENQVKELKEISLIMKNIIVEGLYWNKDLVSDTLDRLNENLC